MTIIFFLLFVAPASAADFSRLSFNIGSYDMSGAFSTTLSVGMILTDPLGRKGGENPLTGESFVDIPNMGVGMDSTDDLETGQPGPENMEYSVIPAVNSGEYIVSVFGISNGKYWISIKAENSSGYAIISQKYDGYGFIGSTNSYTLQYNPAPGAPTPVITKAVTFDVLRNNVVVARQLNQLGDDKFSNSLVKQINLVEKLASMCNKSKSQGKEKGCKPAVAVLNLFIKRLELANHKCGSENPRDCDEDNEWGSFRKDHGKDDDYRDFFGEWDKDDWHKWKNKCKRFVTDEALGIIKSDAEILIKALAGKDSEEHGDHDRDKEKNGDKRN